jgi:hypothetical protein
MRPARDGLQGHVDGHTRRFDGLSIWRTWFFKYYIMSLAYELVMPFFVSVRGGNGCQRAVSPPLSSSDWITYYLSLLSYSCITHARSLIFIIIAPHSFFCIFYSLDIKLKPFFTFLKTQNLVYIEMIKQKLFPLCSPIIAQEQ